MLYTNTFRLAILGVLFFAFSSCSWFEDCEIKSDIVPDLLAPASDIVFNEEVDWGYVISSVKDNSSDCCALNTAATIAEILLDQYDNINDTSSYKFFEAKKTTQPLEYGDKTNDEFNVRFDSKGIFLLSLEADATKLTEERNENNNFDNATVEVRGSSILFSNASDNFKEKLKKASAVIIVGLDEYADQKVTYDGKPVYYVKN